MQAKKKKEIKRVTDVAGNEQNVGKKRLITEASLEKILIMIKHKRKPFSALPWKYDETVISLVPSTRLDTIYHFLVCDLFHLLYNF